MPIRKLITFDWALKRLLRSKANFDILEGFLSELLKEDIKILEILESESNKETSVDKYNRVDLKTLNSRKEVILIEIQYEREMDYLQSVLYGVSKAITEHIKESDPYSKVTKVISVSILYFDLGQGEDYVYKGTTTFKGRRKHDELQLSTKQRSLYQKESIADIYPEYYLLKVNQFDDVAKDSLDEWLYFFKNGEIKDEFNAKGLPKAKKELDVLKLPDSERSEYERFKENLHYQASMYETYYIDGENQGIEKGKKEGLEEGKKQEKLNIARNLLDLLDDETISQKVGFSKEEIEKLRMEMEMERQL